MVRESFVGKVMLWGFVSMISGLILASYRYPFFIKWADGSWKLGDPTTVEANLLVIASLLIAVAVVQGQNLNRLLDVRYAIRNKKQQLTPNAIKVYDYLRIGFWLLSADVIVVLGLLALAIIFGTSLSKFQAFILATAWWSTIALIIAGWVCLAIVGGRSYKD